MLWLAIAVASAGPAELSADGVEATVGQRGITVTADHARWDLKAQRGELAGSVRAVQGDLELRCDSAVVELGGESGGIVRAGATGHVTVSQGHK